MAAEADRLDELLTAVTEPSRRRAGSSFGTRRRDCHDSARELPISRQAVVKHLVLSTGSAS